MRNRYENALAIVDPGACNPSGICHSIVEACNEIKDAGGGTDDICTDPAIRLMVHQLSFICTSSVLDVDNNWGNAVKICEMTADLLSQKDKLCAGME